MTRPRKTPAQKQVLDEMRTCGAALRRVPYGWALHRDDLPFESKERVPTMLVNALVRKGLAVMSADGTTCELTEAGRNA